MKNDHEIIKLSLINVFVLLYINFPNNRKSICVNYVYGTRTLPIPLNKNWNNTLQACVLTPKTTQKKVFRLIYLRIKWSRRWTPFFLFFIKKRSRMFSGLIAQLLYTIANSNKDIKPKKTCTYITHNTCIL